MKRVVQLVLEDPVDLQDQEIHCTQFDPFLQDILSRQVAQNFHIFLTVLQRRVYLLVLLVPEKNE